MSGTDSPLGFWSPSDLARFWQTLQSAAAGSFFQLILPGWTFNINSHNSTSPQTEADVVAEHSYGRQIGRISDVLRAVIDPGVEATTKRKAIAEFKSMCEDIEVVKQKGARERMRQFQADLALLKATDHAAYKRMVKQLRDALPPADGS